MKTRDDLPIVTLDRGKNRLETGLTAHCGKASRFWASVKEANMEKMMTENLMMLCYSDISPLLV
jgi:hypothetical protein